MLSDLLVAEENDQCGSKCTDPCDNHVFGIEQPVIIKVVHFFEISSDESEHDKRSPYKTHNKAQPKSTDKMENPSVVNDNIYDIHG